MPGPAAGRVPRRRPGRRPAVRRDQDGPRRRRAAPTERLAGRSDGRGGQRAARPSTRRRRGAERASGSAPPCPATRRGGPAAPQRGDRQGRRVSFGTYFNAFPASYWRRWTNRRRGHAARSGWPGESTVIVYRSTAKGHSHPVETDQRRHRTSRRPSSAPCRSKPFIDGGWYWFDIVAGPQRHHADRGRVGRAGPSRPRRAGSASASPRSTAPDYLRRRSCARSARRPSVLDMLDEVYVVDQGTQQGQRATRTSPTRPRSSATSCRSSSRATWAAPAASPAAMDETRARGPAATTSCCSTTTSCCEPEGILRAVDVRRPDPQADDRRRPHVQPVRPLGAARLRARPSAPCKWWWGAAPNTKARHDFGRRNLRQHPVAAPPGRRRLQRLVDVPDPDAQVDQGDRAWPSRCSSSGTTPSTGCGPGDGRLPDGVPARRGRLARAVAGQERRARLAGVLPPPQPGRRRAAALAVRPRRPRWSRESGERQLQHLLSMQYSTAALRLLAIEDILTGPEHLHRDLPIKMAQLRELRKRYTDAQAEPDLDGFPPARRKPRRVRPADQQGRPADQAGRRGVAPAPAGRARGPGPGRRWSLPHIDSAWYVLSKLDSAVVSMPDGTSASWYQRDPKLSAPARLAQRGAARAAAAASGRSWPPSTARRRPSSPRPSSGARRSRGRPVTRRAASERRGRRCRDVSTARRQTSRPVRDSDGPAAAAVRGRAERSRPDAGRAAGPRPRPATCRSASRRGHARCSGCGA